MRAIREFVAIATILIVSLAFAAAQQGKNLASPEQKVQQEKAQQSKAGQAGTTEPSAEAPTTKPDETAVLVDGRLAVPGAPADSQTVPAKFSQHNAALDELPTMAFPLMLSDEQKQRIRSTLGAAPVAAARARPAELLPRSVELRELPGQLADEIPAMRNLGFVRTANGILLVTALQRIVVEEIPGPAAN